MKVHLLTDGYFHLDKGFLVYGKAVYYGELYKAALKSLLIETDDDVILVDTGIGELPEKYKKFYTIERDYTLLDQITQKGITPQDVTVIINTHLHMDHTGWSKQFPNAKVYVQEKELDYAYNPHRFQRAAYIKDFFDGLDFVTVHGDYTISDTVDIVSTPGHTPGHQSVVVHGETDYIFCGDIVPLKENLEKRNIVGVLYNPVDALESLDRLRKLEGVHIFSHDNEQMVI
ncbi:MAG: N-acyl homoserine lactonase family protein [Candidatus Methanofastidiosia archaeon]|jgi:glyoxylase-like metal-dependent hydrolase (beta-lactamase superfamily II)